MAATDDVYFIARDTPEAARLAQQHNQYMQCQGYYLHPTISTTLSADSRVAELATGTSIWLQEYAALNPGSECHGFDISDGLFPKQTQANVKLHTHNIKTPFDPSWLGYFDAVHMRFLVTVMSRDDWSTVLKNAVSILKPGGWLQWCENDTYHACRFLCRGPPIPSLDRFPYSEDQSAGCRLPPRSALQRLVPDVISHELGEAMAWGIYNLERLFADPNAGGLADVFIDSYNTDAVPHLRKEFTAMCIEAVGSVGRKQAGGGHEKQNGITKWQEEALSEVEAGTYMCLRAVNFFGRKPG